MWVWLAFVFLTTYGGNLRAFLASPARKQPIGSLQELVQSGLPYTFVLYGEPSEKELEMSQDPTIKKFWENKQVIPYEDFSYERVKDVYEGNSVMVEYFEYINTIVQAAFTLPNGEPLVHVPRSVGFNTSGHSIWAFHPMNPWLHSFEPFLLTFTETGLRNKWENLARQV